MDDYTSQYDKECARRALWNAGKAASAAHHASLVEAGFDPIISVNGTLTYLSPAGVKVTVYNDGMPDSNVA